MGTELLERSSHLDSLAWWWDEAVAGDGRLVFVGGEAGVGKTSLVRRFAEYVPSGTRVLTGDCEPLATPAPLGPLLDMAAEVPGDLEGLLTGGQPPVEVRRAFLRAVDSVRPGTLVIVEDAHWADEATLDLLRYVGRRLGGKRTMVLVTYRDDEIGLRHPLRVLMGDMATSAYLRRLAVPPLSRDGVALLAAGTGVDAGKLHSRTGGNPFFVTEILAAGEAVVPATVRDAVLARIARLPAPVREVVDVAACLGARVSPEVVQEVTGLGPDAVDACISGGVLLCEDGDLAFGHELAREAVAEAVPSPRATGYHASALRFLESRPDGVDPARMAEHAERAGDRDALLRYARAAGARAAQMASHREAAAHFGRALSVADGLAGTDRAGLLQARAGECYLSYDFEGSLDALAAARALWQQFGDPRREAQVLVAAANAYMAMPEWVAHARSVLDEAIALLEGITAGREMAGAWNAYASLALLAGRTDDILHATERLRATAHPVDSRASEEHARFWTALAGARGDDDAAWVAVEEGVAAILAGGVDLNDAWLPLKPYMTAVNRRAYGVAERLFTLGMAYADQHDLETVRQFLLAFRARQLLEAGRWDEASAMADDVVRASPIEDGRRLLALVTRARVMVRRGDAEGAAVVEEARRLVEPARDVVEWFVHVPAVQAEHAWLTGDRGAVRDHVEPALAGAIERGEPWWLGEVAFWLWRVGALDQPPGGMAEPYALLLDGRWRAAHQAWLDLGCPYEAAQALSGADDESALRAALRTFDDFGARGERDEVARRLRRLGVKDIPRARRSAGAPPASTRRLSPREAEVLTLIEEGLRNAEIAAKLFLSERTVEHHVASVLRKLDAHSRVDAVRRARNLGLLVDA
jgi:DNA-binding CsgD family transcriptional regulator/tetratricopeptide (TPR) repeat protein